MSPILLYTRGRAQGYPVAELLGTQSGSQDLLLEIPPSVPSSTSTRSVEGHTSVSTSCLGTHHVHTGFCQSGCSISHL